MSDTIAGLVHDLDLPPRVELFIITFQGTQYFYTNTFRAEPIWWNGRHYISLPLSISGIGYTEDNLSEKPRLQLVNVNNQYRAILGTLPSLKNATLDYIVTFEPYISSSSVGNTSALSSKHFFIITKLMERVEDHVIYEMDNFLTSNNKKFPPRQVLREGPLNFRFSGAGLYKDIK